MRGGDIILRKFKQFCTFVSFKPLILFEFQEILIESLGIGQNPKQWFFQFPDFC